VLRLGKVVGHADPKQASEAELASMMVGRAVILQVEKGEPLLGEPVLVIKDLVVNDDRKLRAVDHLSLEVRGGEILGVAGVQGNGQTELVEAITGLRKAESGQIIIDYHDVTHARPRRVTETGVAHVPEDRQKNGMVATFPVKDNLVLQTYYIGPFSIGIIANERAKAENARHLVKQYDVRTPSIFANMSTLSGGNQQKAIVAREFSRKSHLLLAAQPTRGLDVGSIEFIHKQIVKMRDEGMAVLLVSTELDEIFSLSDRIAVMYAGKIIDTLSIHDATRESVGLLMAGIKQDKVEGVAVNG
jgi:simple sugar transport system ATP-binding protein